MEYGYTKKVDLKFDEAVGKIKEHLQKEGFGVLTEINVKETLKKKLNVDFEDYMILGACSPAHAYRALKAEEGVGLLLPCNVIIYEMYGNLYIATIRPTVAMGMVENEELKPIAQEIEEKLKNVIDNI